LFNERHHSTSDSKLKNVIAEATWKATFMLNYLQKFIRNSFIAKIYLQTFICKHLSANIYLQSFFPYFDSQSVKKEY